MKKIVLLFLSVLMVVTTFADRPRPGLRLIKEGGKWNRELNCYTYDKVLQTFQENTGKLIYQECSGRGETPCPPVCLIVPGNISNIESAIQENLEYYNMTTGTIKYDGAIVYYKNAHLVYDEPDVPYSKYIPEVKGVEYTMTIEFEK